MDRGIEFDAFRLPSARFASQVPARPGIAKNTFKSKPGRVIRSF